jgi:hypothetical protein
MKNIKESFPLSGKQENFSRLDISRHQQSFGKRMMKIIKRGAVLLPVLLSGCGGGGGGGGLAAPAKPRLELKLSKSTHPNTPVDIFSSQNSQNFVSVYPSANSTMPIINPQTDADGNFTGFIPDQDVSVKIGSITRNPAESLIRKARENEKSAPVFHFDMVRAFLDSLENENLFIVSSILGIPREDLKTFYQEDDIEADYVENPSFSVMASKVKLPDGMTDTRFDTGEIRLRILEDFKISVHDIYNTMISKLGVPTDIMANPLFLAEVSGKSQEEAEFIARADQHVQGSYVNYASGEKTREFYKKLRTLTSDFSRVNNLLESIIPASLDTAIQNNPQDTAETLASYPETAPLPQSIEDLQDETLSVSLDAEYQNRVSLGGGTVDMIPLYVELTHQALFTGSMQGFSGEVKLIGTVSGQSQEITSGEMVPAGIENVMISVDTSSFEFEEGEYTKNLPISLSFETALAKKNITLNTKLYSENFPEFTPEFDANTLNFSGLPLLHEDLQYVLMVSSGGEDEEFVLSQQTGNVHIPSEARKGSSASYAWHITHKAVSGQSLKSPVRTLEINNALFTREIQGNTEIFSVYADAGDEVTLQYGDQTHHMTASENAYLIFNIENPNGEEFVLSVNSQEKARGNFEDINAPASPVLSGDTLTNDTIPTISWGAVGGASSYLVSVDGGNTWTEQTETSFTYPSALTDGSYVLQVKVKDTAGNESSVSSHSFEVDSTAPNAPTLSGDTLTNDTTPTISWGAVGGASSYLVSVDGGNTWTEQTETSFTYPSALTDGSYVLQVKVKDTAGNESSVVSHTTEIDTVAPTFSSFVNKPNKRNTTFTDVRFQFSKNLSINGIDTVITGGGSFSNIRVEGSQLVFDWVTPNANGTQLKIRVKDLAGNGGEEISVIVSPLAL